MLPSPHPLVIFQPLDDGAVLFAPETELYFGLNAVGARIWELLSEARYTIEEICLRLGEMYPGVAPEVIRADVEDLLRQLVTEGLAKTALPASPDASPPG
jgi:hypothetical protein